MVITIQMSFEAVGVIDDDPADAEVVKFQIEETGRRPIMFESGFSSLDDLVNRVRAAKVNGVVCDQRLRIRNYAVFDGAEAVARLFESKIPAVLISKYTQIDLETSIRPLRAKIPVLLPKDEIDPSSLVAALERCEAEVRGIVPLSRRPHRTLVRIDDVKGELVDAFVPSWNPNQAIRFPRSIIPDKLRANLKPDDRFFAMVNTDAPTADDLFFENFTSAPKVGPEDDIF
jgi:CheY-like chemotaxis protein